MERVDHARGAVPRVSVVIPVFNGENYLARAIESALAQGEVPIEVLVLDDASTDRTPDIARGYGEPVRYVRLPKQRTSIATTNAGIRLARGTYVSILHHDDYFLPGKLARHVALMDAHPRIGISYSAQLYVDPHAHSLGRLRSPLRQGDYVVAGTDELFHLVVQNYINFCNAVVRREAYERVGPYIEPLWVSSEWEMWVRLAIHADVGYIDEPLVCYRLHPQAQTSASTTDTVDYQRQLQTVLLDIYTRLPLPASLQGRRRFTQANVHINAGILMAIRGQRHAALFSLIRAFHYVRPWELPGLLQSNQLIARMLPRIRLARSSKG